MSAVVAWQVTKTVTGLITLSILEGFHGKET